MTNFDFDYAIQTGLLAIPGVLVVLVSALGLLVSCCSALCHVCGCCSCCKKLKCQFQGCKYWLSFIAVVAIIAIGLALGFNGNEKVTNSVDGFTDKVTQSLDDITSVTADSIAQFQELNASASLISSLTDLQSSLDSLQSDTDSASNDAKDIDSIRSRAMYAVFVVPIVAVLLAVLRRWAKMDCAGSLLLMATCVAGVLLGLSLAAHAPASRVLTDVCHEEDLVLNQGVAPPSVITIDTVLSCLENNTYGSYFDQVYDEVSNQSETLLLGAQAAGIQDISTDLPPNTGTDEEAIDNLVAFVTAQIDIIIPQISSIPDPTAQKQIADEVTAVQAYCATALQLADVASCVALKEYISDAFDQICNQGKEGVNHILAGTVLVIVFLLAMSLLASPAPSQELFHSLNQHHPPPLLDDQSQSPVLFHS